MSKNLKDWKFKHFFSQTNKPTKILFRNSKLLLKIQGFWPKYFKETKPQIRQFAQTELEIVAEIRPMKKPNFKAMKFVPPVRNQKRQYVYKLLVGKKLCFNFVSPPAAAALAVTFVYA